MVSYFMNKYFHKVITLSVIALIVGLSFYSVFIKDADTIKASAALHNVDGWAWSENIGWISFNSSNCDADDNSKSDNPVAAEGCPDPGTYIPPYGVNIDVNELFSGYAWSANIGWISFCSENGPNCSSDDLNGCPDVDPLNCKVSLKEDTGEVIGWAKALAGEDDPLDGWDGWIHFKDYDSKGVNTGEIPDQIPNPCGWSGYAWGEEVIGWINFGNVAIPYSVNGTDFNSCKRPIFTLSSSGGSSSSGGTNEVLTLFHTGSKWSRSNSTIITVSPLSQYDHPVNLVVDKVVRQNPPYTDVDPLLYTANFNNNPIINTEYATGSKFSISLDEDEIISTGVPSTYKVYVEGLEVGAPDCYKNPDCYSVQIVFDLQVESAIFDPREK